MQNLTIHDLSNTLNWFFGKHNEILTSMKEDELVTLLKKAYKNHKKDINTTQVETISQPKKDLFCSNWLEDEEGWCKFRKLYPEIPWVGDIIKPSQEQEDLKQLLWNALMKT